MHQPTSLWRCWFELGDSCVFEVMGKLKNTGNTGVGREESTLGFYCRIPVHLGGFEIVGFQHFISSIFSTQLYSACKWNFYCLITRDFYLKKKSVYHVCWWYGLLTLAFLCRLPLFCNWRLAARLVLSLDL